MVRRKQELAVQPKLAEREVIQALLKATSRRVLAQSGQNL